MMASVPRAASTHLIGAYIAKRFPQGYFIGKVVAWIAPYYRVVFCDWDEEDYTEKGLLKHMAVYHRLELGGHEGWIAEQQPLVDDVAGKWLKGRDNLLLLARAAEMLEASGNQ